MSRLILQRFIQSLSLFRSYFLGALIIVILLILSSIAKAIQTREEGPSQILSNVLNTYHTLQLKSQHPLILESISESETGEMPLFLASETTLSLDATQANHVTNGMLRAPLLLGAATGTILFQIKQDPLANRIITENTIIEEEAAFAIERLMPDTLLNNYLLFTLFPHRKSAIIEEPIARPYQEHTHIEERSMVKFANKMDASLSISENYSAKDGTFDERQYDENQYDENQYDESHYDESQYDHNQYHEYFDTDDEYQDQEMEISGISRSQSGIVQAFDALVYPYLQDPLEILEAESTFENFDNQPISQQIEQLLTTGDYFLLANDPIKARQYYVRAIKAGATDKSSPFYAKALVKLADMEENAYLARFQYTNALDIYETLQGYDMEVADILVKLVWTLDMASERIVIYELLTRAKQIHEKHSYTPQYTEVLRNLAVYYETIDDFERADANYKAALALDLQHLTTADIRTTLALENYAIFYLKYQEFTKAEEILRFKLEAHEAFTPPDYYNLGRTQSLLGWTYLQMNELEESLHHYNSALGNINYSITKNRFMPHYYSLPAIFDLIYFFVYTQEIELATPYFDIVTTLLAAENEDFILRYLQETPLEAIDFDKIVNYPWAAEAEIQGLMIILEYLQPQNNVP